MKIWKYEIWNYENPHAGFPEPTVMWYHGTMKLVPTNNIVTVTTGRRNKLTFLRLEKPLFWKLQNFLTKFTKCWPPSPSCMKSYFFSGQFWIIEISKVSSWPVTKLKMKPFDIVILIFNVAGLVSARYQARTLLVLPALTWDLAWQTLQS